MTVDRRQPTQASPLSLREGSSIAALAFLAPLAMQGLLLSILWVFAQWGSSSGQVVEGVIFEAGSTLAIGAAVVIILAIRYLVLSGYWLLITERYGQSRRQAFLAALPVAGLWWSVKISSRIVRNTQPPRGLAPEFTVATVGFTVLAMLLLPLSMEVATASEKNDVRRLAAPCTDEFPAVTVEGPVVGLGDRGLSVGEFNDRLNEVIENQLGAVARTSDSWPSTVANLEMRMLLWQATAEENRLTASVGEMQQQIQDWEEELGGADELKQAFAEGGLLPDQLNRYACTTQLALAISEEFPFTDTENGSTAFDDELRRVATKRGVVVQPSIGYWNLETLTVDPEEPQVEESVSKAKEEEGVAQPTSRTFSTRIQYEIDSIPNQEFDGSLNWQADICAGASELLQDRFLDRVQLFERREGRWVRVADTDVSAKRGGRCSAGQVNLLVDGQESEPPTNWTDKGWRTCRDYQVRIPETPTFQSATVDMCISTRADSSEEEV